MWVMKPIAMLAAATVCSLLQLHSQVKTEKMNYKGWPNSYRVSNRQIEVVVTGDVGPRIIRFGFIGGQNLLKEIFEQLGESGGKEVPFRGGDRAWKEPEETIPTPAPAKVGRAVRNNHVD